MDINTKLITQINSRILCENIKKEQEFEDFIFNIDDRLVLQELISEINMMGYDVHYLAEIEMMRIPRSGNIIMNYIHRFSSETTRAYLVPQIVLDKVVGCEKTILDLYLHFRSSKDYISPPNKPSPAHIYVRYDNAFTTLKSKKIESQLIELIKYPRDAFYLPLTVHMLASWKKPIVKEILIGFLLDNSIDKKSVGLQTTCGETFYPSFQTIRRELMLISIEGLKNYPSTEIIDIISQFIKSDDAAISALAKKTIDKMYKRINKSEHLGQRSKWADSLSPSGTPGDKATSSSFPPTKPKTQ